jgi:transposase
MPRLLYARVLQDTVEEQKVRKVANSRHAPADWIVRARMILLSWSGLRTTGIAAELGCHPQTVRERIHRFNAEGIDGLGDRPGAGRKTRITEAERSWIISLVATDPLGRLVRGPGGELEATDEEKEAHWTLDALTAAARAHGISVGRSQVRRILKAEGVRWRNVHPWGESHDPEFVPKGRESSRSTPIRPRARRPPAWTSWGRGEPPHLSSRAGLVAGWPPDQGAPGIWPGSREGLGLRSAAGARRPGAHAHPPLT